MSHTCINESSTLDIKCENNQWITNIHVELKRARALAHHRIEARPEKSTSNRERHTCEMNQVMFRRNIGYKVRRHAKGIPTWYCWTQNTQIYHSNTISLLISLHSSSSSSSSFISSHFSFFLSPSIPLYSLSIKVSYYKSSTIYVIWAKLTFWGAIGETGQSKK